MIWILILMIVPASLVYSYMSDKNKENLEREKEEAKYRENEIRLESKYKNYNFRMLIKSYFKLKRELAYATRDYNGWPKLPQDYTEEDEKISHEYYYVEQLMFDKKIAVKYEEYDIKGNMNFCCSYCESNVRKNAKKCPNCGLKFIEDNDCNEEDFICEDCGRVVDEDATECPYCGAEFL